MKVAPVHKNREIRLLNLLAQQFLHLFSEGGYNLFPVADYTVVGFLEDIGVRVFIDGYDGLGAGATSHVLAGT